MTGYIVVSEYTNYPVSLPFGRSAFYRGLGRNPWGQVDDRLYAGQLSSELSSFRKNVFNKRAEEFSPGVAKTKEDALCLARACLENGQGVEVIGISYLGLVNSQLEKTSFGPRTLGLDCYVDGYGSLIELGVVSNGTAFESFNLQINENGLFDTAEALSSYVAAYHQVSDIANLEPIDSDAPVGAYEIQEVATEVTCLPGRASNS